MMSQNFDCPIMYAVEHLICELRKPIPRASEKPPPLSVLPPVEGSGQKARIKTVAAVKEAHWSRSSTRGSARVSYVPLREVRCSFSMP